MRLHVDHDGVGLGYLAGTGATVIKDRPPACWDEKRQGVTKPIRGPIARRP